jgi:hypothetical protein
MMKLRRTVVLDRFRHLAEEMAAEETNRAA